MSRGVILPPEDPNAQLGDRAFQVRSHDPVSVFSNYFQAGRRDRYIFQHDSKGSWHHVDGT
jgi:hypothetical protein